MNIGTLRRMCDSDLNEVRLWRNDEKIRKYMYNRHVIGDHEHKLWWDKAKQQTNSIYLIYENDGKSEGFVSFTNIDKTNENCFWAFYASPLATLGAGFKMEYLALNYAFNDIGVNKLCCEVLEFNTSVLRMHKKFGFNIDGVLRNHHRYDESFKDINTLSLFAEEWSSLKPSIQIRLEKLQNGS